MEYWDLLDENRNKLNIIHERGKKIAKGNFHLIVCVWTFNQGKLLLTKRDPQKETCPNKLENTAGSVIAGEDSLTAALRELKEETGLTAKKLILISKRKENNYFVDSYINNTSFSLDDIRLQVGETVDKMLVDFKEWQDLINSDKLCYPVKKRYFESKHILDKYFNI